MGLQISVDDDLCISSGRCVASLPELFVFDDDEIAHVADGATLPDEGTVLRVARGCPAEAIVVRRDGEIVDL